MSSQTSPTTGTTDTPEITNRMASTILTKSTSTTSKVNTIDSSIQAEDSTVTRNFNSSQNYSETATTKFVQTTV